MPSAGESVRAKQGTVGFSFASHWLRKWREFWKPITERSKAKPKQLKQTCNYFRHSIETRSINDFIEINLFLAIQSDTKNR